MVLLAKIINPNGYCKLITYMLYAAAVIEVKICLSRVLIRIGSVDWQTG